MEACTSKLSKGAIWRSALLIFATVGSSDIPFDRLIKGVDTVAGILEEEVIAQIGNSGYIPRNCEYFTYCDRAEMLSFVKAARLVVSQAGFGTIGTSIRMGKPMLLVPREFSFGEAVAGQAELAEYLASQHDSIFCVRDINRLAEAINAAENMTAHYDYQTIIPELIDDFISRHVLKR